MIRLTKILPYAVAMGVVLANAMDGDHLTNSISATLSPTAAPIYTNTTKAPTLIPVIIPTESPSNPDVIPPPPPPITSKAPTALPTTHGDSNNSTKAPISSTHAPSASVPPHDITPHPPILVPPTSSPVQVPSTTTSTPTNVPIPVSNITNTPVVAPTPTITDTPILTTHSPTIVPTRIPTVAIPTGKPTPVQPVPVPTLAPKEHHFSFIQIMAKTIAWLIIIFLSVIAFGAGMSHRYRIYYYLRSTYYVVTRFILRLSCTNYILSKLHLSSFTNNSGGSGSSSNFDVNTIIFDNDMSEGLLMRENEYD